MRSEDVPLLLQVCGGAAAHLDVLFLHGLTGTPEETWTSADGAFWPKWLCDDLPGVSVCMLGYPASMFGKWAKKEMDLHERAASMLEHLAAHGIGRRPVALVCHSLGGILAKEILRTSSECNDESWKQVAAQTRFAAFLATPHTGASLAGVVKFILPRLSSHYMDLLSNDSGYLTSLNQSYRDLAVRNSIITVPYYEKYKYGGVAVFVSRESADPGAGSVRCIPVDADHVSICKPLGRDAPLYASLSRRLGEVADQCASEQKIRGAFQGDDYAARAEGDRRNLLEKMIDAGREDEYPTANELQNRFARQYYRHGLYTEAKANADAVLSQVEQRFITHVYDKICKRASHEDIASALQTHVIDPLTAGGSGVNASVVLQAVYFLTEQCYLRWDAP